MTPFPYLTLRESAFVLDMDLGDLACALDTHAVLATPLQLPPGTDRHLCFQDLAFLALAKILRQLLSASGYAELYHALSLSRPPADDIRLHDFFCVDLKPIRSKLTERLGLLETLRGSFDRDAHGAPLIPGTSIEVHRLAALAQASLDEARFEYPSLSQDQIDRAALLSSIYPHSGAPFPLVSHKRMLMDLQAGDL